LAGATAGAEIRQFVCGQSHYAAVDDMLRRALGEGSRDRDGGCRWAVEHIRRMRWQVENALLNLAINSRDAMEGHGRLTIEARNAFLG
jgi:hypothetical protein